MNGDTFLPFGPNAGYLAELYQLYLSDPSVIEPEWVEFFKSLDDGGVNGYKNGLSHGHLNGNGVGAGDVAVAANALAEKLVNAYRTYGHLSARISPLIAGGLAPSAPVELTPAYHGGGAEAGKSALRNYHFAGSPQASCEGLIEALRNVYCGSVGFEYMHLTRVEERDWLSSRIESRGKESFTSDQKRSILRDLIRAELFESELHRKYVGTKRFSLEGNDTLIPVLSAVLSGCAAANVKGVVFGMAHRGRLNVLVNTLEKRLSAMFAEFEDMTVATIAGAGDVKYHSGFESRREINGVGLELKLLPNPSHLEFVNPVVEGVARALQDLTGIEDRRTYLPLVMHGDAAFAGQGIVFETINYSGIPGYYTGGTFHIVINNQIGFTTTPDEARSTRYCTDLAKGVDCPVFHVNAEDPEAACWVSQLAFEYRMAFGKDVFVDLVGHRKHGHNEGDDPSFTQPTTYAEIKGKKPVWQIYSETLIRSGAISQEDVDTEVELYKREFSQGHTDVGANIGSEATAIQGRLSQEPGETGVSKDTLTRVARALVQYPESFKPHPKLLKIIEKRVESVESGEGIEWGMAEALAFGSLVLEGRAVRLSGQDCGRGTFSHRHLMLDDFGGGAPWNPLHSLVGREGAKGSFEVINSSLSEAAVLGFEFGYSSARPEALTMWEAQFGDFSNGAQVIIDQFISSSESKWAQRSGVVMMLPHGYEGQGPEHSSARLERYLQMCAEGNMRVCYPSTAAQIFHLLRRQGRSVVTRPLVIMTPKSLLRLPAAMSSLGEMTAGAFQKVIANDLSLGKESRSLIFCSGKIYHELSAALLTSGKASTRLVRLEELYPFPQEEVAKVVAETAARRAFWVQEEPQNMGAWSYIAPHLRQVLGFDVVYVGRPGSASTATGSSKYHALEQKRIISEVTSQVAGK
jgi:2-oxoglutarate dehydrogenase E1 component